MKKILIVALLLFSIIGPALAQKNVLVLENLGTKKNVKYYEGDKIELRTSDSVSVKGLISAIKDTVIVLDFYSEIAISKVVEVQRTRWAISILSKILMIGGAALVVLESVNSAISSSGSLNMNTLYIGAGGAAAGALLIPLQKSRHTIAKDKWKLKILPMETEFNYQKNKTIQF
jgi:uncharacterized ubiquitin-like protein YukD